MIKVIFSIGTINKLLHKHTPSATKLRYCQGNTILNHTTNLIFSSKDLTEPNKGIIIMPIKPICLIS